PRRRYETGPEPLGGGLRALATPHGGHPADTAHLAAGSRPVPQSWGVVARARAASGPSSRRTWKPASSRTGTPRDSALVAFDPGLSPQTTKSVFFDTELVAFAPRVTRASCAWSRVKSASDPVTTTLSPASGFGPVSTTSSASRTPASR